MIQRIFISTIWILCCYFFASTQTRGQVESKSLEALDNIRAAQKPVPIEDESKREAFKTAKVGCLKGMIVTKEYQQIFVGSAVVFLVDAETGRPIHRKTKRPFNPFTVESPLDSFWFAETDEFGLAEFEELLPGRYRLIAQSWSGTKGFTGFDANKRPSAYLILHGTAEELVVESGCQTIGFIRQLGNHTLRVNTDPESPHDFLVVSLQPTLGDGVLGPYGWGKDFCTHAIGITQMEVSFVNIIGLPDKADVHVGLVNYDNVAGLGAASFKANQREGVVRIVAGWSNGHKTPPPELNELVEHIRKKGIKLADLVDLVEAQQLFKKSFPGRSSTDLGAAMELLAVNNHRKLDVPGLGERRLADLLAAYAYLTFQE